MAAASPHPGTKGGLRERFVSGLRHAFAVKGQADELTAEERELLDRLAVVVVRRGMAAPATMLLESVRHMNFIGSQALAFFEPLLAAVFDPARCVQCRQLMAKPEAFPALIQAIQQHQSDL